MSDRAVVALEVVLDPDLPVHRVHAPVDALTKAQPVEIDAGIRQGGGQPAEHVRRADHLRVRVHEDERSPDIDLNRQQRILVEVEPRLAVGPGRRSQAPVETVRPGVVGTLERLAAPLALCHEMAPVPADVHESAQISVLMADDDDRDMTRLRGHEAPRLRELLEARRVLPRTRKDPLSLQPVDLRVAVPLGGKGQPGVQSLADRCVDIRAWVDHAASFP